MKKNKYYVLICLCLLGIVSIRAKENNATAEKMMKRVASLFENSGGIQASFQLSVFNPSGKKQEDALGKIEMKGNKYHFKTEESEVWYDGTLQWISYNDGEVNLTQPSIEEMEIHTPTLIFTYYKKLFSCERYTPIEENGTSCYEIELLPLKEDSDIQKVISRFTSTDIPYSIEILQKSNAKALLTLTHFQMNCMFPDRHFVYDAKQHPNWEVIDLR